MPKPRRLTRSDFLTLKPIRRENGTFFTLAIGQSELEMAKFACIVSKKVALRANVRNLIKRRCRASFREVMNDAKHKKLIFTAKKTAKNASFEEIRNDIKFLMKRATH